MKAVVTVKLKEKIIGENPLPALMAAANSQGDSSKQLPLWKLQQQRQEQMAADQQQSSEGSNRQYVQQSATGYYSSQHDPSYQQPSVGNQKSTSQGTHQWKGSLMMGTPHTFPMGNYSNSYHYHNGYQSNKQFYGH